MNSNIITKVADMIEDNPKHYKQIVWGIFWKAYKDNWFVHPSCYTPCCIAGHILVAANKEEANDSCWDDAIVRGGENFCLKKDAQEKAGLTIDQGDVFFSSEWPKVWANDEDGPLPLTRNINYIPGPDTAVKVLRRLAQHGFSHDTFEEYHQETCYQKEKP